MIIDRINVNGGETHPILGMNTDCYYEGIDLTEKFANEISASSYNDNPWAWIRARIRAGNYLGIHNADYIPIKTTNNITLHPQIAGIDTYRNSGNPPVGHHIDFICKEIWPTLKPINAANYNNGLIPVENVTADGTSTTYTLTKQMCGIASITVGETQLTGYTYDDETCTITFEEAPAAGTMVVKGTGSEYPWLASDMYLWLNSLKGHRVTGTSFNPPIEKVDYTQDGVYYYLPQELKDVIVEKRFLLDKRYSDKALINNANTWDFANIGKLWLPTEIEVYGESVFANNSYQKGLQTQYPLFIGNMNRIKYRSANNRAHWWLLLPFAGNTTNWCFVYNAGNANNYNASNTSIGVPVCFRVA